MIIPLYIPIGAQHHAVVRDVVWKVIACEQCAHRYAFRLQLEASATVHDLFFSSSEASAEHARAAAMENFHKKVQNIVVAVPCPHCGAYQAAMVQKLKDEKSINALQIVGAIVFLLSFTFLFFNIQYDWLFTTLVALPGLAVLAIGYRRAFRFDPNAGDAEPRKAISRKLAISGEQLDQLLSQSHLSGPAPHMN